jgi:hypothetical protein
MNYRFQIFLFLTFSTVLFSCSEASKYSINQNYIRGISKIDRFTIAELTGDKFSPEYQRVCLEASSEKARQKAKLYFKQNNNGYYWQSCTLDLKFVENDTLKDLSLEEKLDILKKENPENTKPKKYEILPWEFKPGKWYHFFGFDNIEGSFFVYVEKDKTFRVEYFGGGPW